MLSEALDAFIDRTDICIAQHHWPTWDQAKVRRFIEEQRDMYLLYKIVQSEAAKRSREKKKAAMDPLEALGLVRQT